MSWWRRHFFWYWGWKDQLWTLRVWKFCWQVKGPKCTPLFSERNGFANFYLRVFNWRLIYWFNR